MKSLFLFAHQDDEFGVFQMITDELAEGKIVTCAYFTSGVPVGFSPSRRNRESISVLESLGVLRENILFVGECLAIPDGGLIDRLSIAKDWLINWIISNPDLTNIYLPAWEGGHPDHDLLHALGIIVSGDLNLLGITWQYPLYNGYGCKGKLFRVFLPLPSNGPAEIKRISRHNRLRFLRLIIKYPSQIISWIGLFPCVLWHYIFFGTQVLQRVSISAIQSPPHSGLLYYERRKFARWSRISNSLERLMK